MRVTCVQRISIALFGALLSFVVHTARAQLPLFSGAEGFGGTFNGTAPSAGWFGGSKDLIVSAAYMANSSVCRGVVVHREQVLVVPAVEKVVVE